MEIKAQLLQPFNEEEKINFIVEQNHNKGYEIRETETALEAWGYTEEEIQEQERERLNLLSMTKREMFLGLYQAKGITPDMLKAQITDPQALIEFEYANDYYRGNVLIDQVGAQLGITPEQLDKFFETKDYHELLPVEDLYVEDEKKSNTNEIVLPDEHANGTGQASDASSNSPVDLDEGTNVDN